MTALKDKNRLEVKYLCFNIFLKNFPEKLQVKKKVKLLIYFMVLALSDKNIFPLGGQRPAIPKNWGLNQESAGQATFLSSCHFLAVGTHPAFCHHLHLYRATAQTWERLLGKDVFLVLPCLFV